jgi:hypothetical protein
VIIKQKTFTLKQQTTLKTTQVQPIPFVHFTLKSLKGNNCSPALKGKFVSTQNRHCQFNDLLTANLLK